MLKKVLFILIAGFAICSVQGQNTFPESWKGTYSGDLHIYGVDSIGMTVTMELEISKKSDSVYQWKMTYMHNEKRDIRDYVLKIKNINKGHYLIDEQNSILIDGFYKYNTFTSHFSVNDAEIITTYRKSGANLVFDVISSTSKNASVSGSEKVGEDDIPEVISNIINGRQQAVLYRKN